MFKVSFSFFFLSFYLITLSCSSDENSVVSISEEKLPQFNKAEFKDLLLLDSVNVLLPKYLSKVNGNGSELARYNSLIKELEVSFFVIDDSIRQEHFELMSLSDLIERFKMNFESEERLREEHTIVNKRNTISIEYSGEMSGYPFKKRQLMKWYRLSDKTLFLNIWCREDQFKDLSNDIRVIQRSIK